MMTGVMNKHKALTEAELREMTVLVVGLARSGVAASDVLLDLGAGVRVTDARQDPISADEISRLKGRGVRMELGGNSVEFASGCDALVVSPGVPLDNQVIRWAYAEGKPVLSEIELAYCLSDARFVAVTGTNGKSTTVSLLGTIISCGTDKVKVGGNIGFPISPMARGLGEDWILVVEVSSFQLDTCISFRPEVAVLLNITPDHLNRYPSYEAYIRSKARLFANQGPDDMAIINLDDPDSVRAASGVKSRKMFYSIKQEVDEGAFVKGEKVVVRVGGTALEVFLTDDLRIKGPHNLANSLAAALAATLLEIPPETIRHGVREFPGLEHRFEYVDRIGKIEFINDSKATNPESMATALEAAEPPVVLIAGGKDKGGDFSVVAPLVAEKVHTIFAIGEARAKLHDVFSPLVNVVFTDTLEEAVRESFAACPPSGRILLAPGCASFDMFIDFEHRGREFKKAVKALKEKLEAEANE
jgi:UDP-N-acetylmuramoylalanine--D-glutamate ligase